MILGITGGSGSGKTTLLRLVEAMGGLTLDCDAIYHRLLATDSAMAGAIGARFPGAIRDGAVDRKALGAIVFADEAALRDLNAITHAAVKAEVRRQLAAGPKLAAIDAIALFESGLAALCDLTVAVTAPTEQRVARLMAREGIDEEYARLRIAAQRPDQWFRERCAVCLENDGTEADFRAKCLAFFHSISII